VNIDASDARAFSYQTPDVSDVAGVVVASGFLDDTQNAEAGFGLFVYTAAGGAGIELDQAARLQVIHNAADPGAASVDVYLGDALGIDDFAFRTATPFITVPSGVEIPVGVAPPTSASVDDAIATVPVTLAAGSTNTAVANGVLDPNNFEANPDGNSIAFGLLLTTTAQESAADAQSFEFNVVHGATDAPTVDVRVNGGGPTLVDDAAYGAITPYIAVTPAQYILDLTTADGQTVVATYALDATGFAGVSATVLASGFLTTGAPDPDENAFALIFYTADGGPATVIPLD
jgi:hypothetical protein